MDMHPCTRYVQVCRCTTLYALAMYTLTVAMSWVRCAARGMGSAHVPVGADVHQCVSAMCITQACNHSVDPMLVEYSVYMIP